jgi:2,3-bisphosphoglycerate-independent phosphoglycerate mutase
MSGMIGDKPLVLVLLDGWGIRAEREGNALAHARTPVYDRLAGTYPHTVLTAAGPAVGLAQGKPGNAQAGYMAMGAGAPVEQDLLRVNRAVADDGPRGLAANPVLQKMIQRVRPLGGAVHLIGLVSPGGVAGHQNHLAVLAARLSHEGLKVFIHGVMDGIDVAPKSGILYLSELLDDVAGAEHVQLASLMGRGLAFDETATPDNLKSAWKAIADANAPRTEYLSSHLDQCHAKGLNDDRVPPAIFQNYRGIRRDDAVFLVNLRPDLGAPLMQELIESETGAMLSSVVSLVQLDGAGLDWVEPLFPRQPAQASLAESFARAGLNQLLLTETVTEKHLSLFWRGGVHRIFENETLALAETPVARMEKRPDLAAADLTIEAMNAIKQGNRDFLLVNFANVAMLARTGNMRATIDAAEAIDKYLGKIAAQVEKRGLTMAITSAYGGGEMMEDPETGKPRRSPSAANMPFTLVGPGLNRDPHRVLRFGALADVAPTLLGLMNLAVPASMTGRSLIVDDGDGANALADAQNHERPNSVPA